MTDSPFDRFIKENKKTFLDMGRRTVCESNESKKILLTSQAALYAIHNPCGILNSQALEEGIIEIAQKHSVKLSQTSSSSVLHVLTLSYLSGGHTRVCERWISASPSDQKVSVALINQGNRPIPQKLYDVVEQKDGDVLLIEGADPLEKALSLRQLASEYEYIVLHVHMQDVVPLLAFGTDEFKCSVTFYNHADHLFWLGCSIADSVVNFRSLSAKMSEEFRGVSNNYVLPLPVEAVDYSKLEKHSSKDIKKELGIPSDCKVIITVASPYKFVPSSGVNFFKVAKRIIDSDPKVVIIAIGPSLKDTGWQSAYSKSQGRIMAMGMLPYEELCKYIHISDVAIDSFPISSFTALLDVARHKVPCVMLESPINSFDCFEKSGVVVKTEDGVVNKVLSLLQSKPAENILYDIIQRDHMPSGFAKRLESLFSKLPKKHIIHPVKQDKGRMVSDFERLIIDNSVKNQQRLKGRAKCFIRKIIYWYVANLYPIGMTPKLYVFLSSRGLI